MSNATLKKIVNIKVHEEALKYLIHKKKSKTLDVPYTNIKRQEYFEANNGGLSLSEKQFIFQCRSRMLAFKCNMKKDSQDFKCSACGIEDKTEMHLSLSENLNQDIIEEAHVITYIDLFSEDITKIKVVGNILKKKMKKMFLSSKIKLGTERFHNIGNSC